MVAFPAPVKLIYVDNYGADPTGAADSTTAIKAAQAAGGTSPYQLAFSVGTYVWGTSGDITAFQQNQGITGQGQEVTNFVYKGNATAIPVALSGAFDGTKQAGKFTGFTLSGFSAGGSAVGLKYTDLQGLYIDDVAINGFSGTAGIYAKNVLGWSEQADIRVRMTQNTSGIVFDTGSFDYSNYDIVINANSGQDGITLQGGANLQGVRLRMRGNFHSGAGNTGAAIAVDRGNTAGTSFIKFADADVAVEQDGSTGTGHFSLLFGSSNSVSQFTSSTGVLAFAQGGSVPFQGYSNPHGVPFGFAGTISDPVLGTMVGGDGLAVQGAIDLTQAGTLTGTLFANTIFFNFGDTVAFQLANGAQTLTFSSLGTWARKVTLLIAQPSSGAAGTITWPANVKWPAGAAPSLSSTNNFVDKIHMEYYPVPGNWYAELAGTHYA
jgi:hypothetical protein